MEWRFTDKEPVYMQIMAYIRSDVLAGVYAPGDKIPSVRELAMQGRVNPNTVQRAMTELEAEGELVCKGTLGRFVTTDETVLKKVRHQVIQRTVFDCAERLAKLNVTMEQAAAMLRDMEKKEEDSCG